MAWQRKLALGGMVGAALLAGRNEFAFAHENVIGTSMDLRLVTIDRAAAETARDAAMNEIARLEKILSTYSPSAELARMNAGEKLRASAELVELLNLYDAWHTATDGAISATLSTQRGWEIDCDGFVRVTKTLSVDALGKAYVAQKAAEVCKRTPGVTGGVLDIGGDLVTWGADADGKPWRVAVADPHNPAENSPKIAAIDVYDAAIATSGSYARGRHIIDPRTGESQREVVSATVVANDLVTANALATALNVSSMDDAKKLMKRFAKNDALAVNASGAMIKQGAFFPIAAETAPATKPAAGDKWPAGFQVNVPIDLNVGGRRERPFVVVWIEDDKGTVVRVIEFWGGLGKDAKYVRDLKTFWGVAGNDAQTLRAVTRASRSPGLYSMTWDGLDQKGNALPAGNYFVWLEVASEHGGRAAAAAKINCGADKSTSAIRQTNAFNASTVTYGPKEKAK